MSHTEQMREALERIIQWDAAGLALTEDLIANAKAALTAPAAEVPEPSPDDLIRVAVFGLGASELCAKYEHVQHEVESHLDEGTPESEDSPTYMLTFKTMTRAEFDALGEFDGF